LPRLAERCPPLASLQPPPPPARSRRPPVRLPSLSRLDGLLLAAAVFALALLATPPAGQSATAGLVGLIRLGLYAAVAGLLAVSGPSTIPRAADSATEPALSARTSTGGPRSTLGAHALLASGMVASLA